MAKRPVPGLPSRQAILDFISSSSTSAGKREIARAFGLHAADKIALKALLKDMADEGLIDSAPGRAFHKMGGVPKVTVLRIADIEGDTVIAVPENWEAEGKPPPRLRVIEQGRRGALGIGDRILARTEERGGGIVAHVMKKLARGEELILGVVEKQGDRYWLKPVDKRDRKETLISDLGEADPGDLVLAEKSGRPPRITARVKEILGDPFAPKSFSLIAIHKLGIPHVFSEETMEEAAAMAKLALGDREDLRHLPSRATLTMPSGRARAMTAALMQLSRLRTSASMSAPVPISTRKPASAETAFTSPILSCRCCPKNSQPMPVRSAQAKTGRPLHATWLSIPRARLRVGGSRAR
jgi:ribonuclease R